MWKALTLRGKTLIGTVILVAYVIYDYVMYAVFGLGHIQVIASLVIGILIVLIGNTMYKIITEV